MPYIQERQDEKTAQILVRFTRITSARLVPRHSPKERDAHSPS